MKKFRIGIWDHCRYVTNFLKPYDEMARHLERMRKWGVTLTDIYLVEVISLDDYCRAAANCGMEVEARITPAWSSPAIVNRTLPETEWQRMEKSLGIRLAGPAATGKTTGISFWLQLKSLRRNSKAGSLHSIWISSVTTMH